MSEVLDGYQDLRDSAERQGGQPATGCAKPQGLPQEWELIRGPHNFLTFVPYHWRMHITSQRGSPVSALARTV
jgi:hypothetical protein